MTFRWLPDPERYTHPRLSWLLQVGFDVVLGWMFRVEHDLPPGFQPPPGTLLVANHLRDADAPILGTLMFQRKGLRLRGVLPYFALREDLFQDGGLANLLYAFPRPFIHLLRLVPMRWLFGNMRTLPMRRLREFTWHDTLRELAQCGLGDRDPASVFNARGLRELRAGLGRVPARVDAIRPWRLRRMRTGLWGLRRLALPVLREIAAPFRATITRQLHELMYRLDAGACLYFAPEGHVSMDGRFGRIRSGTWRLGRIRERPLHMLPFAVGYDPLGPGRTRVLVRMGAMLDDLDFRDSRALARRLRTTIMARRAVTPSDLLAWFLTTRSAPFSACELAEWLVQGMQVVRAAGRELDPEFARVPMDALVARRLRWLRRKRLVRYEGEAWRVIWPRDTPPGWMHAGGIVRYLANGLAESVPAMVEVPPR